MTDGSVLNALRPDLLYVCVFGPGFGESIVFRIPPDTWGVVDGCRAGGDVPAARLLKRHDAEWSCLVLTHPHEDHAAGLDTLLAMAGEGPIGCADPRISPPDAWSSSADPERHLRQGTLEHVMAAIQDRWEGSQAARWLLRRGESKAIGEADLLVLHPDEDAVREHNSGGRGSANRMAAAMLLTWRNARILLGADVVATDWASISAVVPDLSRHSGLKIPHHGSSGALHASFGSGDRTRLWIGTPYNRGRKLPRFEDGEGMAAMLEQVDAVHLTGLPVAFELQERVPFEATRQGLRDGTEPRIVARGIGGSLRLTEGTASGPDSCFVLAGFDADGRLEELHHGPGAVIVRDGASSRS
jgi:beta-lactamase superfamily II metal-dependent hydrolase